MDTTVYEKLVNAGIRFISYRPRSEKEIRDFLKKKLNRWKVFGGTVADKVIARLTELDYVDDAKFAAWWVEQRQTFRPKGIRLIKQELRAKGIGMDIAEELMQDLSSQSSDGRSQIDYREKELASNAVRKKLDLWQKLPSLVKKKRIYDFLSRRGFAADTIGSIIDELMQKE
ncbi:regulatory protein RecX [Candidatus Gottesmanbacteria bacterium]|nr:regulatory protein RecX [Candidatus Gottesmanbacteria bacterium]